MESPLCVINYREQHDNATSSQTNAGDEFARPNVDVEFVDAVLSSDKPV